MENSVPDVTVRCKGRTAQGDCKNSPMPGGVYCFFHDPAKSKDRLKAQLRGGFKRKTPQAGTPYPGEIETVSDVVHWCNCLLADTWMQANGGERTRSVAAILRISLEALQVGSLEQRVKALEELVHKEEG